MNNVIKIDQNKCIGCGMCARDCAHNAIKIEDKKAVMTANSCMECGHCVAVCPKNAVSMNGYDMEESIPYNKETFEIDANTFLNKLKFRRSIRKFKKQEVEREKLEKIIEAGRFTPTGSNKQNVRYVVMENPAEKIEPLAIKTFSKLIGFAKIVGKFVKLPIDVDRFDVSRGFFFHESPVVIFVISESPVNASLASANMGTMAEAQGLGLFYVGLFTRAAKMNKKIRKQLHMTKKEQLVTAIAIGYPAVKYQRTVPRKKAEIEWM